MIYAGIEAGGTKFVCAVGTGPLDIEVSLPIPTTTPEETMALVLAFLVNPKDPIQVPVERLATPLELLAAAAGARRIEVEGHGSHPFSGN